MELYNSDLFVEVINMLDNHKAIDCRKRLMANQCKGTYMQPIGAFLGGKLHLAIEFDFTPKETKETAEDVLRDLLNCEREYNGPDNYLEHIILRSKAVIERIEGAK